MMVMASVREYRLVMRHAANLGTLEAWYDHMDVEQVMGWVRTEVAAKRLGKKEGKQAAKDVAKARTRDHLNVFAKRADEIDGKLQIVPDPPLIVPIDELVQDGLSITTDDSERLMHSLIQKYRRSLADHHHPIEEFEYIHTARKVVVSAAWEPAPGSTSSSDATSKTPCSSSRRKPRRRCSSASSAERAQPPRPASRGRAASDAGGQ